MAELSALPLASALTGSEVLPSLQGSNARRLTATQLRDFAAPLGLARGPRVAYLGDSILANGQSTITNVVQGNNIAFWAHYFGRQRYDYDLALNFAVGSTTTTQHVASVAAVIAAQPDILVYLGGTNDIAQAADADLASGAIFTQITNNLTNILDQLSAAGIHVVMLPLLPRQTGTPTAAFVATMLRTNMWIRTVAALRRGVTLCDPTLSLVHGGSTTYAPTTGVFWSDNLHPNTAGAISIGRDLDATLQRLTRPRDHLVISAGDSWSNTHRRGNLLSNGLMLGTSGTRNTTNGGTAPSGSLADTWQATTRVAGPTVVCAKVAHPTIAGTSLQEFQFSGTGANGASGTPGLWVLLDVTPAGGNIAVGDTIELTAEVEYVGVQGLARVETRLFYFDGTTLQTMTAVGANDAESSVLPSPFTASGAIRTPRVAVGSGMTYVRVRVDFWFVASATLGGAVRIGRFAVRKPS